VVAICRGLTKAGVAPSAKHFPGHGDTHVDSHISLPIISKDATSLAQSDLIPFRAACDVGAASIMIGHIALPSLTGDTVPASLSSAVIGGLLRESLAYDGVAVTDCLEMAAIAERPGGVPSAAVDALRAGADIAMICHRIDRQRDALEAVYSAIQGGALGPDELRASGRRIAAMKDTFAGNWEQVLGSEFDKARWARLKAEHAVLSHNAYAASIALVRNPPAAVVVVVVPLPKSGPVVVLTPGMVSLKDLVESVSRRVGGGDESVVPAVYSPVKQIVGAELQNSIVRATSVIFVTRNTDRSPWQLDQLREVIRLRKDSRRVVVLATCGPYDLLTADIEGLRDVAYVASFEYTVGALDAAVAVIFGEEVAKGTVPVCGGNVLPELN
jgi:beta-N-acetylhexosaminidase